jgi:hypothetical protein
MEILFLILKILLVIIVLCFLRTWQLEHGTDQKRFLKGTVPHPHPEGFYPGTVPGDKVPWLGKKFDGVRSTGINLFGSSEHPVEKFSFKTSVGKGARDMALDVFRIDYNISHGPLWARPILDEIVEIAPNHYLGKLQFRVIPTMPFTLVYFELKK